MAQILVSGNKRDKFFQLYPSPARLVEAVTERFNRWWDEIPQNLESSLTIPVYCLDGRLLGTVSYITESQIPVSLLVIDAEKQMQLTAWIGRFLNTLA